MLYHLFRFISWVCDKLGRVVYITGASGQGLTIDIYMVRYVIFKNQYFSLYLHRFLRSDRDDMHDHPWNFWTYIISGVYYEYTPKGVNYRSTLFNRLVRRQATDLHKVVLARHYSLKEIREAPFTICLCGKRRKGWGFLKEGKIIPWKDYLKEDYNEHSKNVIEKMLREQNANTYR